MALGEDRRLKAGGEAGVVVAVHIRFHQIPVGAAEFRVPITKADAGAFPAMIVHRIRPVVAVVSELLVIGVGDEGGPLLSHRYHAA